MLKQTWQWAVRVPHGLTTLEKIYLYGVYVICVLFALYGLILMVTLTTSDITIPARLALIGLAVASVALALALRIFIFWIFTIRRRMSQYFGLR